MTSNMTQDEIIEMAMKSGCPKENALANMDILEDFAKLVAAKERERITDEYWSCIQSDLEHGVKSLNQKATEDFYQKMPELSKFGRWLEARGEQHEQ